MTDDFGPDKAGRRRRRRRRRRQFAPAGASAPVSVEETERPAGPPPLEAPLRPRRPHPAAVAAKPQPAGEGLRVSGIFDLRKDGTGFLRQIRRNLEPHPADPVVQVQLTRKFQIKEGSEVVGRAVMAGRAPRLQFIESLDGLDVNEYRRRRPFKKLTVIDPDFHYELGGFEQEGQISMRVLDLLCPLGRGQRALLVAPPRSGKTMLMQQIARAMEVLYPDVHLIVLLVDERPEEATYWQRSVRKGDVFSSTLDRSPEEHVALVERVQARAERLVEAGREVMILLDSITRMARAYNHVTGNSGKTLSGGLDARTMAKPKNFFGAARNTEDGGALTIVGTTLVDTGSRMDQVIFEEFKGTGNMELVLDRRLADRRIYPAIAVDRTGTRKDEKLLSRNAMRKITILRRVLSRMKPFEALELLVNRLQNYPTNQDFLAAFSMDDVE